MSSSVAPRWFPARPPAAAWKPIREWSHQSCSAAHVFCVAEECRRRRRPLRQTRRRSEKGFDTQTPFWIEDLMGIHTQGVALWDVMG